jgi:hypothetical protein
MFGSNFDMEEDDKEFAHQHQMKINHQEKMSQKEKLHHQQEEEHLLKQHQAEQLRFQKSSRRIRGKRGSRFHQGMGSSMQRLRARGQVFILPSISVQRQTIIFEFQRRQRNASLK